jgi:hypothetical protein
MIDLSNMKVSELVEHLFNIYSSLFSRGALSEEEMLFAITLTDYNRRALVNSINLGIQNGMLPIAEISVWQHANENELYTIRVETVGTDDKEEDSLGVLVGMVKEAVNKWGDEEFDGIVSVSDPDNDDTSRAGWILPTNKKDE